MVVMLGISWLALSPGTGITASGFQLPFKVIVSQVGDIDGFGFGSDVCPIGCTLPSPPTTQDPEDPPFTDVDLDTPTCVSPVTWTHDFTDQLPEGAQVLAAFYALNIAGIEPAKFASRLVFDNVLPAPLNLDQGALESGPFIPSQSTLLGLIPFVSDGMVTVKVIKGGSTRCDDLYFDASLLIVLVQLP
jgi:hypothetical protein